MKKMLCKNSYQQLIKVTTATVDAAATYKNNKRFRIDKIKFTLSDRTSVKQSVKLWQKSTF